MLTKYTRMVKRRGMGDEFGCKGEKIFELNRRKPCMDL
jgi:hypothetical protein